MNPSATQDATSERSHYERLYERDGDHHFIAAGYDVVHDFTVKELPAGASVIDMGVEPANMLDALRSMATQ